MNERDRQTLRRVFADALDWQESLLATYYTEIDATDVSKMRVPRSLKADARRVETTMTRYRRLRATLLEGR